MNLPLESVLRRLRAMCRRGYFNGYLNERDQFLCLSSGSEPAQQVVIRPGCGARNAVRSQTSVCRCCGAPLTHP